MIQWRCVHDDPKVTKLGVFVRGRERGVIDPDGVRARRDDRSGRSVERKIHAAFIEFLMRRRQQSIPKIGIARTRRRNIISEEYRADYFRRRPLEDIERQNSGQQEEEYIEPVVEHQIPERAQLAELICTHVAAITTQEIVARRIHSAGLMVALCRRREVPRRYRLRVALP
jgi:hypothetical protein